MELIFNKTFSVSSHKIDVYGLERIYWEERFFLRVVIKDIFARHLHLYLIKLSYIDLVFVLGICFSTEMWISTWAIDLHIISVFNCNFQMLYLQWMENILAK